MAYEIPGKRITVLAGADLTNARYKAVIVDNTGRAVVAGAGAVIAGVLQLPDTIGRAVPVMIDGASMVMYGASVTAGDMLSTDTNGNFVKATAQVVDGAAHTVTTVGTPIVGVALVSGAANTVGTMLIK